MNPTRCSSGCSGCSGWGVGVSSFQMCRLISQPHAYSALGTISDLSYIIFLKFSLHTMSAGEPYFQYGDYLGKEWEERTSLGGVVQKRKEMKTS